MIGGFQNSPHFDMYYKGIQVTKDWLTFFNAFIPNCDDFNRKNCLKDRQSFHEISDSSMEMSCWGTQWVWNFESR
jgi:hypothetical protein